MVGMCYEFGRHYTRPKAWGDDLPEPPMNTAMLLLIVMVAVFLLTLYARLYVAMLHDTQDRDPYHRANPPASS